MLKGFKEFLLRGNVLDLAVGIIVGGAFTLVVAGLQNGILNPLIAAIFGKPDISKVWQFTINGSHFSIGLFFNAVLNFVIVAAALYFVVVMPVKHFSERVKRGEEPVPEPEVPSADVVLLQEIRDLLAAQQELQR
ncbi:MAG: large conductance mechanosensitive channel protein MscL [Promicromonosporaceae bacterium]|nr:large conductance mechanosensitive channel protein MscL [Promicromonosporaceae bacterium]